MKTDHWFYGLFQSAPDLIALLLPAVAAAGASAVPSLGPDSPGDALYRFEAPELLESEKRLKLLQESNARIARFEHELFSSSNQVLSTGDSSPT